jgi:hypothetical protein
VARTLHRRDAFRLLAAAPLLASVRGLAQTQRETTTDPMQLSAAEAAFLDDLERRGSLFFIEQANPANGQVLDRATAATTTGKLDPTHRMASIAATGFGLTALCIADFRGYMPRATVLDRVRRTLRFHADHMEHNHGFFSHFNDIDTGYPYRGSEVSPIDTSLLLCGVLTARQHFAPDREIQELATKIYHRVDWPWMLNGGLTLDMGWRNGGFLSGRWNHYCELMMMYLFGLGSPTYPLPAESWDAWSRPKITFDGITYIGAADPLFVHQYSQAWFDFRNRHDAYADYFQNSVLATRAHKAWCLSLGKPYTDDYWGITASDSAHGYRAWGGPPGEGGVDGSVVPCATGGSLPFLPQQCLRVLQSLKANYGDRAWGRYGFCDALHPAASWYDTDVLGIDAGITVLMAENLRSGFVWKTFMQNPEAVEGMRRAGFVANT